MIVMFSILIGVVTGVMSSLIAWWILFHYLSPEVIFSPSISKRYSKIRGCGFNYQFTIQNIRRRIAINVSLSARLTLLHFPPNLPDNISNILPIPLSSEIVPFLYQHEKGKDNPRRISFLLDDAIFCQKMLDYKAYLPPEIIEKAITFNLKLEDLLSIAPNSFIRLAVILTDSISSSQKIYISKKYMIDDIKEDKSYEASLVKNINHTSNESA